MILRIEDIKDICSKLLTAVDSTNLSTVTETLELEIINQELQMSVTNREYIVTVKIPVFTEESFHATVNAEVFLKLMNQITTETVTFSINNNMLNIVGNGTYTLPMIYENEHLMTLPKIDIENQTSAFNITLNNLMSIYNYNAKELTKEGITNPVQKLYYVDKDGCITFTTGACVNNFNLGGDVVMLLPQKIVKLFKLFNTNNVAFKMGHSNIGGVNQTRVRFENSVVTLTAIILSDDTMINAVPKDAIRGMAMATYDNSVVINRQAFLNSINRLMLFTSATSILSLKPYGKFKFEGSIMKVYDGDETNVEDLHIENTEVNDYEMLLDLSDVKNVLESSKDDFITMNFGNHQAVVIQRPSVYNVIPECTL